MKIINPDVTEQTLNKIPVRCDCIMTAAGLSSRMGEWKLILPYRGEALLDVSLKNALAFCDRVILVTGYRGAELAERYRGRDDLLIVHNPDYQQGLTGSVQRGVAASDSDYLFITHGDLPCIPPQVFRRLWQARSEQAIFPRHGGEAGHPVLLPRTLARRLAGAPIAGPVRRWLLSQPHAFVEVESDGILFDVDTLERYQALLTRPE